MGTSQCVRITGLTASAAHDSASACLRECTCVGMIFPHSCRFTEKLKQKLKERLVNMVTLSVEQALLTQVNSRDRQGTSNLSLALLDPGGK